MSELRKIPKLRFEEFSGEWKVISLGDISFRSAKKNKDNHIDEVFTNSAVNGIVSQRDYFDKDIANQNNLDGYYIVNKDDFVYNPRISNFAPVGPLHRNHLGSGVMSPLYTVFKIKDEIVNLDFIERYFHTTKWHRYMNNIANYGARSDRMNITNSDFIKMPILLPSKQEQEKIASFLSAIDSSIEQLTKKEKLLREYKKGVMQKIFSQEIRFKDDDGSEFPEWENLTLGEVAKFRRGSFPQPYGLPKWYDDENGLPFVQVFDVDDNMKLKPTTKNKISRLAQPSSIFVEKGSIVLTIQGSIGRIALTQYDAYADRTLLIFTDYLKAIDKKFFIYIVYLLFEIEKRKAPGGTIKTITKEALTNFLLNLPCLKEQTKIANFLLSIDTRIEQVTKQLNHTKEFKKALLQKMFV